MKKKNEAIYDLSMFLSHINDPLSGQTPMYTPVRKSHFPSCTPIHSFSHLFTSPFHLTPFLPIFFNASHFVLDHRVLFPILAAKFLDLSHKFHGFLTRNISPSIIYLLDHSLHHLQHVLAN